MQKQVGYIISDMCEATSTLHTHSQGNIEEVCVCLSLRSKLESMPPPKKQKNKKQNQGREGKK